MQEADEQGAFAVIASALGSSTPLTIQIHVVSAVHPPNPAYRCFILVNALVLFVIFTRTGRRGIGFAGTHYSSDF